MIGDADIAALGADGAERNERAANVERKRVARDLLHAGKGAAIGAAGGTVAGGGRATPHAPYQLTPVKAYARAAGVYPDDRLEVDREFVKAGGKVEVTARAEPGASVTFYSGESPGAMTKSKTVRADENGRATAVISVKKKSNMGGVVFGARQQGSSETQYSERVGVIQLEENGAPGAGSEGSDEE